MVLDGYRHLYHTGSIRFATHEEIKVGYRIDHQILQFDLS
ncbi:hypothetical protein ABLAC_18840 [Acinetobacter baumannii LAC-4]|nr:hypothetical protein ABLAC_18840 [Acinetobacter baumannii LAC-4]EXE20290.1 hypothetical protein J561_2923 [Acinetobacter baumannii 50595]